MIRFTVILARFLGGKENYLSFSHDGQKVPTFAKERKVRYTYRKNLVSNQTVKHLHTANIIKSVRNSSRMTFKLKGALLLMHIISMQ